MGDPKMLKSVYEGMGIEFEYHEALFMDPLVVRYRNLEIHLPPPPSEGGIEVAIQLQVLEGLNTSKEDSREERIKKIFEC